MSSATSFLVTFRFSPKLFFPSYFHFLPNAAFFCSFTTFSKFFFQKKTDFSKYLLIKMEQNVIFFLFWFFALFRRVSRALELFSALIQALFDPFFALFGVQKSGHTAPRNPRLARNLSLLVKKLKVKFYFLILK